MAGRGTIMYQILCDSYLLHSDIDEYMLKDVKLTMEANLAGSLQFEILQQHPNAFALAKLKPEMLVLKNGLKYWKGRITEDNLDMINSRKIYCEGKLKVLEDTLIRPAIFDGTTAVVFAAYLTVHNSQVTDVQKLLPGTVNVTGNVYRDLKNHESTYSRIQDLVSSMGGYLRIRYEADGDYLDWLEDFTATATQQIALGENLLDLSQDVSAKNTYSACIPLGAKLLDENGQQTEQRLTVESVHGVDYVFNQDKVNEYGWKYAPASEVTWDDVTTASALLSKAQAYLADKGIKLAATLQLTALDLNYTDTDIDSFNFCEYITVNSTFHGIVEEYLLSKIEVDITNPANTKITLGESFLTLTDKTKQEKEKVTFILNELVTALTGTASEVGSEIAQRERYIRYINGIIELGETNSDLKMRLSNTELAFGESLSGVETKVAYIANPTGNPGDSKLYVENGKFLKSCGFGDTSAIVAEPNGSVSIAGIS